MRAVILYERKVIALDRVGPIVLDIVIVRMPMATAAAEVADAFRMWRNRISRTVNKRVSGQFEASDRRSNRSCVAIYSSICSH